MIRRRPLLVALAATGLAAVVACSSSEETTSPGPVRDDAGTLPPGPTPAPTSSDPGPGPAPDQDGGAEAGSSGPAGIYAHSADTLYVFDPEAHALTTVGTFDCLGNHDLIDLAVNGANAIYGTVDDGRLVAIDAGTAACTVVGDTGEFLNNLSFVPVGTVDATQEALVGYLTDGTYVRIDPASAQLTGLGDLNGTAGTSWVLSGDVVALANENGRAFAAVFDQDVGLVASLAEVDPRTGEVKTIIGSIGHPDVFGLAYWKGKLYGFDSAQQILEISATTGAATVVSATGLDGGASSDVWLGAGVTTLAPKQ